MSSFDLPGKKLDHSGFLTMGHNMKQLTCLTLAGCASVALALTAFAGTEMSSGKEMKQVAPAPPPECNWTGFYIGLNVGGQFGHSEDKDLDDYNFPDKPWGYDESGVVAG